jgi:hypothetical protein
MDKFEEALKQLGVMGCGCNLHYGIANGEDKWTCRIILPQGHKHAPSPPWGEASTMVDALLLAVRMWHKQD